MITSPKAWLAAALVLISAMAGPASAQGSAPSHCYSDWATAASVVDAQKLVTVERLSRQFRRQKLGDIVKTELCQAGTSYIYRLVIRTENGRFRTAIYDAQLGIEVGVAKSDP